MNGSVGVTGTVAARMALAGLLSTSGSTQIDATPGVMYGPAFPGKVTGSTSGASMKYICAPGVFATCRAAAGVVTDGIYLWANSAPVTVDSTVAAPGSGTRFDLIYALAHNSTDGFADADSNTGFGVLVGVAGSSPVKPYAAGSGAGGTSLPAGALVLAESLVGTSIANASLATITSVAPWKVARGAPIPCRNQAERDALTPFDGLHVYRIDLDTTERSDGTNWFQPSLKAYMSRTQVTGPNIADDGSWHTFSAWTTVAGVNLTYSVGVWTILYPGYYAMSGQVGYDAVGSPTGQRAARITVNGAVVDLISKVPSAAYGTMLPLKWGGPMAAGDVIHIDTLQSQGSTQSLSTTPGYNHFEVHRVGDA